MSGCVYVSQNVILVPLKSLVHSHAILVYLCTCITVLIRQFDSLP